VGVIDGSLSFLYSNLSLEGIPSATPSIPLRSLVRGYRDISLPPVPAQSYTLADGERKPTLLHATLALPPPSTLTALYTRHISPRTLFSLSLNSKSISSPIAGSSPPASVLAHAQHDTGRYRVEALGSTESALLGLRGLWNFGYPTPASVEQSQLNEAQAESVEGLSRLPASAECTDQRSAVQVKPSLLSAGAEVYYSPLSSVIGLSTGLRFTTLPRATPIPTSSSTTSKPLAGTSAALTANNLASAAASSFPYTMTLTATPLTGSLASTYSIKPTPNLALSSRFGFNVYSWESEYVLGAEIWRQHHRPRSAISNSDGLEWAREKAAQWLNDTQKLLLRQKKEEEQKPEESVIRLTVDDNWNIRALWTGRVKELLVSTGVNLSPTSTSSYRYQMAGSGVSGGGAGIDKRWKGSVGVEIAYSS
jgi:mitochondrial distribution and morphology protein 10